MRLAMAGAQHQGTDPQQERLETVEQLALRDGFRSAEGDPAGQGDPGGHSGRCCSG